MKGKSVLSFIIAAIFISISFIISAFTLYTQSIRLDESQSIWFFTKSIPAILALSATDVNLPLYGILLHFWLQFFGTNIIFARTLSFIFYLATIPVLYKMAKENGSKSIALTTVVLFSFSPFIIWYSSETRTYTLFVFLVTLNNLFFLRFIDSKGTRGKLGYFLTLIAGYYTHYFFLFFLATQGIYLLVTYLINIIKISHETDTKVARVLWEKKSFILTYIILTAGSFLFFVPWIRYVISLGSAANTQPLIPKPTSFNIFQTFVTFLFGFQSQSIQAGLVSLWPLVIVILFFIFTKKNHVFAKHISYFVTVSFAPVLFIFAVSLIRPIFLSRYMIFVTPTLFFLLAWIFLNYSRRTFTVFMIFFLSISSILAIYQAISNTTPVREDYQEVANYLDQKTTPQDIVAVSAPFTIYPLEYTYRGHSKIVTIPNWDRYSTGAIPPFTQSGLITQMNDYSKTYSKVFVVLSYNQGYEKNIKQYLDNHYQRMDKKQFSQDLEVDVYKLRYDKPIQ